MSDDDEQQMYRAETVPPPDGEADPYNSPTKVGPMAANVVAEMMRGAEKKAAELNAKAAAASKAHETAHSTSNARTTPPPPMEKEVSAPAREAREAREEAKEKEKNAADGAKDKAITAPPEKPKEKEKVTAPPPSAPAKAQAASQPKEKAATPTSQPKEKAAAPTSQPKPTAPRRPQVQAPAPVKESDKAVPAVAASGAPASPAVSTPPAAAASAEVPRVYEEDDDHAATLLNRDARRNPNAATAPVQTTSPVIDAMGKASKEKGLAPPDLTSLEPTEPKRDRSHLVAIVVIVLVASLIIYLLRH